MEAPPLIITHLRVISGGKLGPREQQQIAQVCSPPSWQSRTQIQAIFEFVLVSFQLADHRGIKCDLVTSLTDAITADARAPNTSIVFVCDPFTSDDFRELYKNNCRFVGRLIGLFV